MFDVSNVIKEVWLLRVPLIYQQQVVSVSLQTGHEQHILCSTAILYVQKGNVKQ